MTVCLNAMRDNFGRRLGICSRGLFAVLALGVSTVGAQAQTVTLADAFDLMLDRDVQYEILDIEENIAAELVRQARGERLPRVGLAIRYIQTQQVIVNQDNTTFQEGTSQYPTTRMTFSVRQPLYDPVRWRALPQARAEEELVAAQAAVARNQLTTLLIGAYLDVARAQIGVEQARIMIRARSQLESDLAVQVDAGVIEADTLLRAQGDVFEARAMQAERELDLTTALFELYRFTGPEVTGVSYAGASVGIPNYNELVGTFSLESLLAMSPAIQVARAELDVSERQEHVARAAYQPTANLALEFEYEQTEGSLFGGGSTVQSTELGLNVDWSIYEGGLRRSRMREAGARVQIANLRLEQITDLTERRYDALTSALGRSFVSVRAIGAEQSAAGRRLGAAIEQEDAGRIGPQASLEARLRRDTMALQGQIARLRVVQLQAELLALFGALDVDALSQEFRGT
ncbi:outer membrane efflux protein [Thalassobium sp. R2A62]|nr:outer membrane efflux protein [Thalassobium sp. R2A62]